MKDKYIYLHPVKFVTVVQSGWENVLFNFMLCLCDYFTKYIKECLEGNVVIMILLELLQLFPQMVHVSVDV